MNNTKAQTIKGDFYEKNAKRLYAEHLDNPKKLRNLFLILVKNNNVLRNNIEFYEELVEMHEKDESPEITNLNQSIINYQSIIKDYEEKCRNLEKENYDISCDYEKLEQEKEEKWIEHIEPVEDSIRKAYQDEIDKLKKERDDYKKQIKTKDNVISKFAPQRTHFNNLIVERNKEIEKLKKIIENQSVLIKSLRK